MDSYFLLVFFAFWANVPLGYFRENTKKFSFAWFFFVHASIPFIILLRLKLHISPWFIPVSILAAIMGQLTGSRLRQIKSLNISLLKQFAKRRGSTKEH